MSVAGVVVRPVTGAGDLDRFVRLPWSIYGADPQWVPPLLGDVRATLDRKHPFYQHAEVALFLAWRGGRAVGRIAAIDNRAHCEFQGEENGFFGLFECEQEQAVAAALLGTAEAWLRARGRTGIQGPFNLSTNDELSSPGILVDGFDTPPIVMMSHNPPYYGRLLEQCGYTVVKDMVAYWVDRVQQTPERLVQALGRKVMREDITVRPLRLDRLAQEVAAIEHVYNAAWEKNWGFIPMTPAETAYMAKHLRPVAKPELCLLAFDGERPVGFLLALPDYNQAIRHLDGQLLPFGIFKFLWYRRRIDRIRVITLGVTPDYRHLGLDGLLIAKVFEAAVRLGMAEGECSWILEDNHVMRRGIERIGGRVYKTYRVFGKPLAA